MVGKDAAQEVYHLHCSLLCANSDFFRGCLKSGFSEARAGEVSLSEEDPSVFQYFVKWIYLGKLVPISGSTLRKVVAIMIDLYALADRPLSNSLKNEVVDVIRQACLVEKTLSASHVLKAVQKGTSVALLTNYLIRQLAHDMYVVGYEKYTAADQWPELIAADTQITSVLIHKLRDCHETNLPGGCHLDPAEDHACQWHVHADGEIEHCVYWNTPDLGDVPLDDHGSSDGVPSKKRRRLLKSPD